MGKHAPPRHASCVLCNNDAVEETKNNLTTIQRSWSLNEIGFSFGVGLDMDNYIRENKYTKYTPKGLIYGDIIGIMGKMRYRIPPVMRG